MNIRKFFIPALATFALLSCTAKTGDSTVTEENVPATAGTVVELTDAATLAPGVKVDRLTVIDFNAVWCGPCRQLAPVLAEMAEKYAGKVDFYSVDVDRFGALFEAYNVGQSIPAVVFLTPDGKRTDYVGTGDLLPAEKFEAIVDGLLK